MSWTSFQKYGKYEVRNTRLRPAGDQQCKHTWERRGVSSCFHAFYLGGGGLMVVLAVILVVVVVVMVVVNIVVRVVVMATLLLLMNIRFC